MKSSQFKTSDISRAVGVHPNTVRLYEVWGYLPPIPRSSTGYRKFSHHHLQQMKLARLVLEEPWPGRIIRKEGAAVVRIAAAGDLLTALDLAHDYASLIRLEISQTRIAADYLQAWAEGKLDTYKTPGFPDLCNSTLSRSVTKTAALLHITSDTLRHWERNGLISIPRDPSNNYRQYGPQEIDRLRILRLLTRAGYSTMAVLRMVRRLDQGRREDLINVLDTPDPNENMVSAADRWMTTLSVHEKRAVEIINLLKDMIADPQ